MQNIQVIIEKCGAHEMLDQLTEECAELIQACEKYKRAYRGTTPVPPAQARKMLVEELADVAVASAAVFFGVLTPTEQEDELDTEKEKLIRWKERIEAHERTGNQD